MNKKIFICEKCGSKHDGKYGSGRFCSKECARSFSVSHVSLDGRKNQIKALNDPMNRKKAKKKMNEKKRTITQVNSIQKYESYLENNTNEKFNKRPLAQGKYGELSVIKKCIEHNVPVYIPVVDDSGVDLIIDINNDLKKVQVKSSNSHKGVNKDKISFQLTSTKLVNKDNKYQSEKTDYKDKVDFFALCDISHDDIYLIENDKTRKSIQISRNRTGEKCYDEKSLFYDECNFSDVIENLKRGISQNEIVDVEFKDVKEEDE